LLVFDDLVGQARMLFGFVEDPVEEYDQQTTPEPERLIGCAGEPVGRMPMAGDRSVAKRRQLRRAARSGTTMPRAIRVPLHQKLTAVDD